MTCSTNGRGAAAGVGQLQQQQTCVAPASRALLGTVEQRGPAGGTVSNPAMPTTDIAPPAPAMSNSWPPTIPSRFPPDLVAAFVAALRKEYVRRDGAAVGDWLDSVEVDSATERALDKVEKKVRKSRDPEAMIAELERGWSGGPSGERGGSATH